MGREDQIIQERTRKLHELRQAGINPYPNKFEKKDSAEHLQEKFKSLAPEAKGNYQTKIAGRIINIRDLGKIAFVVLQDGKARIQLVFQEPETSAAVCAFLKKYCDSGDCIGVEGTIFRTKRGELSIQVQKIEMLAKALLPLPEKWHGLQDDEERLRKRYLDITINPEVYELFIRKSKFWNTMRSFLLERGFLEVETPVLENSAGGASATPFSTHHNALNLDVYLRISMGELWQKKLMVAGFPKTFEIGRQFRNEGMDAEHLQDYTQMEFYWGYANYEDGMQLVEAMYKKIAQEVYGKTKFTMGEHEVELNQPWGRIDYAQTIKKYTDIDIWSASEKDLQKKLQELKVEYKKNDAKVSLIDTLWKYCRKKITGPVFLVGHPEEVSPLAKRDPKNPKIVERFQPIIAGSEVGNGYSELNDPLDQEERFKEQQKMKDAGDAEAQSHDFEFVEALKHGMPPTCGFGVSERLFSFFEGKPIRETVIFPLMKPLKSEKVTAAHKVQNISSNDISAADTSAPKIVREEAVKLLKEFVKSKSLITHCLAVEASVRAYAKKYGANEDMWGLAGLLHDFDYEKHPGEHPLPGVKILKTKNYPELVTHAILSHVKENPRPGLLDKVLFAVDELSGFVVALSKVRAKGFEGMTSDSIEKALKKKDFAKNVSRKDIEDGIAELGVDRKEHFELVIHALSKLLGDKQ